MIRAIVAFLALTAAGFGAPLALADATEGGTLALTGATIYPAPGDTPIVDGVVLVRGGRIVAAGAAKAHPVPADATRLDCDGLFIVAGFQNSHVHFTEPKWEGAAQAPAAQLSSQLEEMLLRWGATTVVDTGSLLSNTLALRARIESGEVRGPRIYTVGTPTYPYNGIPYYLRESLPPEVLRRCSTRRRRRPGGRGDHPRARSRPARMR